MSVDILIAAAKNDEFPYDRITLSTFWFNQCDSVEELSNLLGLYKDITLFYAKFKKNEFEKAVEQNTLLEYILTVYNQPSYYFDWFKNEFSLRLASSLEAQ